MARNRTLLSLLDDLRAECRLSTNPAHNAQQRDTQVRTIQRMQEFLYDDFSWPHLRVERLITAGQGQRFYPLPADVTLERIEHIEVRFGQRWMVLDAGIGPAQYGELDSDSGMTGTPVRRWRNWEDAQIELWPVPDANADPAGLDGLVKVVGIRNLRPFRDDADVCDLDDRLIVLYAASELLAAAGAKDATLKLQQATQRYQRLRSDLSPRRRIGMFRGEPARVPLRGLPLPRV